MTLEKPKTVADVLEAAADLIEPEGRWIQGDFRRVIRGKTCFCAMGAIAEADRTGRIGDDARVWLMNVINSGVVSWNDDPRRTQVEVVAALRSAASLSRQNEEKANG